MSGTPTEVRLLGQKIALKTSGDPAFAQEVVSLVSAKLEEAEKRAKGGAPHLVALLALLNLAEEYALAKKRTAEYQQTLDEKSRALLSMIESEIK